MNRLIENTQNGTVTVFAHRGAKSPGLPPENTMPAFRYAIGLGVDGIETDIHQTKDGVLVLMHDHGVERTTDGEGRVCDFTFEELRKLDAGVKAGEEWKGTPVPGFEEFLDLVEPYPDLLLNLELKDYPDEEGELSYDTADRVIAAVERRGMADRVMINCFDWRILSYIHDKYGGRYALHGYYPAFIMHDPQIDVYPYLTYVCLFNCRLGPDGHADWSPRAESELMPEEDFRKVKNELHCDPCVCFRTDTPELMKEAIARGVTMFTCNRPADGMRCMAKIRGELAK